MVAIYADKEMFPVSAYIVIGSSLFFAFVMVGLLATDLSFTLKNKASDNLEQHSQVHKLMQVGWFITYWANLFFGTVLKPFF